MIALRAVMAQYDLAAYYVPYDAEGRREWISGFMGSNGDAIVTNAASGDQVSGTESMTRRPIKRIYQFSTFNNLFL